MALNKKNHVGISVCKQMYWFRRIMLLMLMLTLVSCASFPLTGNRAEPAATYLLELPGNLPRVQAAPANPCLTLSVSLPRSAPGFGSVRMAYVQKPYRVDYFARHQWADTPARMLHPLLVQAFQRGGLFRNVVAAPAPVNVDLRLDSEVLRLQQVFKGGSSDEEFSLRAELLDVTHRQLLFSHVFTVTEPAAANDPYGGVVAANRAVERLVLDLESFIVHRMSASALACKSPDAGQDESAKAKPPTPDQR